VTIRQAGDDDWEAILKVADASLPWQTAGNREWLENRKRFDESFPRRHYVAQADGERRILGYGSLEGGPQAGRFRVFVVTDATLLETVGESLYRRLREDLVCVEAQLLWVREEKRDQAVLSFFQQRGFQAVQQFRTEQGLEVVMLEQRVKD